MAKVQRNKPDREQAVRSKQDDVADAIGSQLRDMYDSVLKEPVPDDLSKLVRKLSKSVDEKT